MQALIQLIQPLRKKLSRLLKVDIVRLPYKLGIDANILDVIEKYDVDVIIDAGANEGQFAARMRDSGFRGVIHSFEPVKSVYEVLKLKAANDASWHTYNAALGKELGQMEINVSRGTGFCSFLSANDFGQKQFAEIKLARTEIVEVTTVDEFVRNYGIVSNRIFLKMDTQGFDFEVFSGARSSMSKIVALVSELAVAPIYNGMRAYREVLEEFEKWGFCVSGFHVVSRRDDLSLIEADCIMVKGARNADSPGH
jgi:FkbM family methyltransferase